MKTLLLVAAIAAVCSLAPSGAQSQSKAPVVDGVILYFDGYREQYNNCSSLEYTLFGPEDFVPGAQMGSLSATCDVGITTTYTYPIPEYAFSTPATVNGATYNCTYNYSVRSKSTTRPVVRREWTVFSCVSATPKPLGNSL